MAHLNISVSNLPSIIHNNIPVITTDLLADVYETDKIRIQQNYTRNTNRFIEEKHFFKLTGSVLKDFKNRLSLSESVKSNHSMLTYGIVGRNARSLVLWTERGAARHAKMLDTDRAWDVFEILEDTYFTKHKFSNNLTGVIPNYTTTEDLIALVDKLQKVIHEGDFIPAGQTIHEYHLPKTGKTLSNIINDFINYPKKDTLHILLAWLKKDGHNVEDAERVLEYIRAEMKNITLAIAKLRTHAQYIEHVVSQL
ncbi:ORF6N domain-containing protein [Arsenophonus sp.]|uniref:ORF6N domain-containing protein n=1 Tax=Arsenophonus sp. TaxID=1872640 RepID=UPI00387A4285